MQNYLRVLLDSQNEIVYSPFSKFRASNGIEQTNIPTNDLVVHPLFMDYSLQSLQTK